MNQRIIVNKFNHQLSIEEYCSILKETNSPAATSILFYVSSLPVNEEIYCSSDLWENLLGFKKTMSESGIKILIKKNYLFQKDKLKFEASLKREEKEKEEDKYSVYCHIFPNKKKYIGISNNIQTRWKDGKGYENNSEMWNDIIKYGWNNIQHEIIKDNLTKKEALKLERRLIEEENSIKNGYNRI
jgi:hypothetical protein